MKERFFKPKRGKHFCCPTIFCSHTYHKIVNNFIFEQVKNFFLAKTLTIVVIFAQRFVIKLSKFKIWVWIRCLFDPGYGIRDPEKVFFRIPDPGSRIPDPGSRIPDPGSGKKPIPDHGSRIQGQKGTGFRIHNTACFHFSQKWQDPGLYHGHQYNMIGVIVSDYNNYRTTQCSGSMTFWCGSGSADPCL